MAREGVNRGLHRLAMFPAAARHHPGGYLPAEAIGTADADLAVHGYAGTEHGGVKARNVAQPVIGQAFSVYNLRVPESPETIAATGSRHEP